MEDLFFMLKKVIQIYHLIQKDFQKDILLIHLLVVKQKHMIFYKKYLRINQVDMVIFK